MFKLGEAPMLTRDLRERVYIMGPIQAQTLIGLSETRVMRWEKLNSMMKWATRLCLQ